MERAAIQGDYDARRIDLANSISREWVERLRRDAMLWTTPQPPTDFSATKFLGPYRDSPNPWELPVTMCPAATSGPNADGLCPAFDIFGRDLAQDHFADAAFCVNIRVDTVATDTSPAPGPYPSVLRAIVRVYYPRGLLVAPFVSGANRFCSVAALTGPNGPNAVNGSDIYYYVQAVTLLSANPIVQ
jgi:hypothetical protein